MFVALLALAIVPRSALGTAAKLHRSVDTGAAACQRDPERTWRTRAKNESNLLKFNNDTDEFCELPSMPAALWLRGAACWQDADVSPPGHSQR